MSSRKYTFCKNFYPPYFQRWKTQELFRRHLDCFELLFQNVAVHRFLAIDFETADYRPDSACAVGLVLVESGKIQSEYMRLIRPPRERIVFSHIHGLTWAQLRSEQSFPELWPELLPYFENIDFIVAHNSAFDRNVLRACCAAAQILMPEKSFQCTVQVARRHLEISPAKLSNVCEVLGLELNHHEALSDARACARIMMHALERGYVPKLKESSRAVAQATV